VSENADTYAGLTLEAARRSLAARFRASAIESPELDARILVGSVTGLDLTGMIAAAGRLLTSDEATRLEEFARRRCIGEPVARILGSKEFWGLPLRLSAATLVPRPETETVVELALQMVRADPRADRRLRIADIGTGSGAILLALLSELPGGHGVGTDVSEAALRMATVNAANLGLADRGGFVACYYAAALSEAFELIVSNPPYIRSAEIASLATEVRDFDPTGALDGGKDGLDAYRAIVPQAARLLASGGALVVEVGYGQSEHVESLMTSAGLKLEKTARVDLAGIPRAVAGRKLPP
jgi:release factor glutamine methyltransferase